MSLRIEMPETAKWVDALREMFGLDVINGQIKASEVARRTYERILAAEGQEAADTWRRANWKETCVFYAVENGRTIGLKDPFGPGIKPCIDAQVLKAAHDKVAAERAKQDRRRQHGAN